MIVPPAQAFRCGTDLVHPGDRPHDVVLKCGEPDFRERHAGTYIPGAGPVGGTEIWYYNPGGNRLLRILVFRQGRLQSIETAGRGFSESAVRNVCRPHELYPGMSTYELLGRCGEPAARESWLERTGPRFHDRRRPGGVVLVEEWTYLFGSNRFRRHMRVVGGRVVDIRTGGRGP